MPRLSDTMTEGKVAKWHKNVGDTVKEGDILAEIETDKAVQDFESEFNGTLLFAGVAEGNSTKVDDILAIIGLLEQMFLLLLQVVVKWLLLLLQKHLKPLLLRLLLL
jgi:pyruvate/2-oxoglutarate dehydrogenase complex dihydrolipoamide acyltransferase (E2) component